MNRTNVLAFFLSVFVVASVAGLRAGPPPPPAQSQLTFQARITQSGQPVSGLVALTFQIVDSPLPGQGQVLWSEDHDGGPGAAPRVSCSNGIIGVVLGSVVPIPSDVFTPTGGDRYVAIVLGGTELARVKLTAGAYAVVSSVAGAVWDPATSSALDVPALDGRYFRRLSSDGSQASVPSADALRDPATGQALTLSALDSRYAVGVSSGAASVGAASKLIFTGGVSVVTSGSEVTIDVAGSSGLVESLTSAGGHSKTATIPAGTLAADGEALHVWASGDIGGGGGLRVLFAGVSIFSSPSMAAARGFEAPGRWVIEGRLIRTGPSSVVASFHVNIEGLDADIGSVPESFVQPYLLIDNLQLANVSYALTVDYDFPVGGGFNSPPPETHSLVNVLRVRKEGR